MRFWLALCGLLTLCIADLYSAPPELEPISLKSLDLADFRGRRWDLDDFPDDSILVVAFLGTECPLAKHYSIKLREMAVDYEMRGVRIVAVMSNRQDSLEEINAFATRQELSFPVLKDAGNRLADQLGADRTPEIFVFDSDRNLRYRGRVDDQYGVGYVRDQPQRRDLQAALDELLADQTVSVPRTRAVGCIIGRSKLVAEHSNVTYGNQIAEILNRRCVECHRDGEIAPFSLTDYDEVAGWSDMIAEVVREERMPPWHAKNSGTEFENDRSLTTEEKEAFYAWAEAGAPAGELSRLPKLPKKLAGWQLPREPDLVIPVSPEPFDVPATGTVRYQYFRFDPNIDEDVWIEAAELKPGNREVVHHILAFAVPKGERKGLDGARSFLVGYVPGQRLQLWPKGHAKKVPAGSELIFQVHYTPIGIPQKDQSSLGILWADPATVTHEVVTTSAVQARFRIPPGEPNHQVNATSPPFPPDATLLSLSPHMHVRGKAYEYELEAPDGGTETILSIPAYDFNWQTTYILAKPQPIPAGSRFLCTATFDNSAANLNNPDPTQVVKWGDQTWDEMMIGYYHYSVPYDPKTQTSQTRSGLSRMELAKRAIERAARLRKFDQLDSDKDGKLAREDTPPSLIKVFDSLDKNADRILTREEVAVANE
jgi:peroxiredoxin